MCKKRLSAEVFYWPRRGTHFARQQSPRRRAYERYSGRSDIVGQSQFIAAASASECSDSRDLDFLRLENGPRRILSFVRLRHYAIGATRRAVFGIRDADRPGARDVGIQASPTYLRFCRRVHRLCSRIDASRVARLAVGFAHRLGDRAGRRRRLFVWLAKSLNRKL